jgi:transcriptional regulator with XRE-family HTH domain
MKNLTLEDIARRAGVSPATVSRVINDQVGARSNARAEVRRIIHETGFQAHAAASSLAARRTNVLGLLYAAPANTVLTHPNLLNLAEVLTQACHEAGQVLSLFLTASVVLGVIGAGPNRYEAPVISDELNFVVNRQKSREELPAGVNSENFFSRKQNDEPWIAPVSDGLHNDYSGPTGNINYTDSGAVSRHSVPMWQWSDENHWGFKEFNPIDFLDI